MRSLRRILSNLAPLLFAFGFGLFTFGYGYMVGRYWIFPADHLTKADSAARGMWLAWLREIDYVNIVDHEKAGAILHEPALVQEGVTFLVSYAEKGFNARLIDVNGKLLHTWTASFDQIFPDAPQMIWRGSETQLSWHGAHLFPNGDVVFNFQGSTFPYAAGLVRIDKDSKLIWKLARNTHHDVTLDEDGNIWVPALNYQADGLSEFPDLKPWYYEDTVLKLSPDGEVLDQVSVLKALEGNPALVSLNYQDNLAVETNGDPLHLNNAEPLPTAWASQFPMFKGGDLLVSMRNINTVAVIDYETKQVKWSMTGPFVRQHDPDFLPNGHILVYDNRGGDPSCGLTRVLEIDPATQVIVWSYTGCGGNSFYSRVRGEVQQLANGNVLIIEATEGRLVEVTHTAEPKIVWEYVNSLGSMNGRHAVGIITHAQRVPKDALSFLDVDVS